MNAKIDTLLGKLYSFKSWYDRDAGINTPISKDEVSLLIKALKELEND